VDDFRRPNYAEWGDFVNQPYTLINSGLKDGKADCQMERKGHIWAPGGPWDLVVAKQFTLDASGKLTCSYRLNRASSHAPAFFWASELNFTLLSSQDKNKYLEVNEKPVSLAEIYSSGEAAEKFSLVNLDDGFRVNFTLNQPARLWCWPVETVNQSEGGLEKNYQGSSLLLLWNIANGAIDEEFVISMDVQC
jgi:alpha-amylase